jgi:hypothetical protein
VDCDATISEGNFVADLHFVKQPVRIALQYLGQVYANVASGLPEAIHDSAQGCFVNAQHACQAVLPDASRVHPQLEVRVNVSIQGHGLALDFYSAAACCEGQRRLLLKTVYAILEPNLGVLICQHIVDM